MKIVVISDSVSGAMQTLAHPNTWLCSSGLLHWLNFIFEHIWELQEEASFDHYTDSHWSLNLHCCLPSKVLNQKPKAEAEAATSWSGYDWHPFLLKIWGISVYKRYKQIMQVIFFAAIKWIVYHHKRLRPIIRETYYSPIIWGLTSDSLSDIVFQKQFSLCFTMGRKIL